MERDPFDLDTAQDLTEQRELRDRLQAQREADDLKWLLSSVRGRRIVFRLLQEAGIYRSTFNTNALQMSFNEGNRNAGLKLLALITDVSPERYADMIKESKQ